jgi:hypothetical protein
MSQVGLINPRTTDFGIGPTNFVGYDQYGTDAGDYTPNEELLRNLNAPGYNPVNEGDYGYEEVALKRLPKSSSNGFWWLVFNVDPRCLVLHLWSTR